MLEPNLPLTVPFDLWLSVAEDVRDTFADSYLSGAVVSGKTLLPHTVTAHLALSRNPDAMKAIKHHGCELHKPLPFGDRGRPNGTAEAEKVKQWDLERNRPKAR